MAVQRPDSSDVTRHPAGPTSDMHKVIGTGEGHVVAVVTQGEGRFRPRKHRWSPTAHNCKIQMARAIKQFNTPHERQNVLS